MRGYEASLAALPAAELGIRTVRVAIEEPVPSRSRADFVGGSLAEVAHELRRMAGEI